MNRAGFGLTRWRPAAEGSSEDLDCVHATQKREPKRRKHRRGRRDDHAADQFHAGALEVAPLLGPLVGILRPAILHSAIAIQHRPVNQQESECEQAHRNQLSGSGVADGRTKLLASTPATATTTSTASATLLCGDRRNHCDVRCDDESERDTGRARLWQPKPALQVSETEAVSESSQCIRVLRG
jgi:hypothetical protein